MPNKKSSSGKAVEIRIGDISGTSGNVNVAGGNIANQQTSAGVSVTEINRLFDEIYAAILARPQASPAQQGDLKAEVHEIQAAVTDASNKSQPLDEGFLARHFRNIARMAPDILDVVVATLANPLAGLGVAARKIAAKAKEDTGSS